MRSWIAAGGGGAVWGAITGTLSNQTDLQTALNGKLATSGTAADSSKLNGVASSVTAVNNTIVRRHTSGYIYTNYFNTTPNTVPTGVTQVCVGTGHDGFIRHGKAAALSKFLGGTG